MKTLQVPYTIKKRGFIEVEIDDQAGEVGDDARIKAAIKVKDISAEELEANSKFYPLEKGALTIDFNSPLATADGYMYNDIISYDTAADMKEKLEEAEKEVEKAWDGLGLRAIEYAKAKVSMLKSQYEYLKNEEAENGAKYFVLVEDGSSTTGSDMFDNKTAANDHAEILWNHLTDSEKKNTRVHIAVVTKYDLDDPDDWESFSQYNEEAGLFDSKTEA